MGKSPSITAILDVFSEKSNKNATKPSKLVVPHLEDVTVLR